jgi:3-hydroxy-9,10-secoandrosta-1,3,5(10)-triene-9,17-dione monooxygenase reductase component
MTVVVGDIVDPSAFRDALGRFLTGVTVVTARAADGAPVGMTANAFTAVSLSPPLVAVAVARSAASQPAMDGAPRFAVHILRDGQESVSQRFARSAADGTRKFEDLAWKPAPDGLPLLEEYLARLECRTWERVNAGDHVLYVGCVERADVGGDEPAPLAYFRGRLTSLPHLAGSAG